MKIDTRANVIIKIFKLGLIVGYLGKEVTVFSNFCSFTPDGGNFCTRVTVPFTRIYFEYWRFR